MSDPEIDEALELTLEDLLAFQAAGRPANVARTPRNVRPVGLCVYSYTVTGSGKSYALRASTGTSAGREWVRGDIRMEGDLVASP